MGAFVVRPLKGAPRGYGRSHKYGKKKFWVYNNITKSYHRGLVISKLLGVNNAFNVIVGDTLCNNLTKE